MSDPAMLTDDERRMLTFALDQAQEKIWSEDGFTDEDQAAIDSLRRLTGAAEREESGPHVCSGCRFVPCSTCPSLAQPPRHRWAVETRDGVANEWAPGTRFLNRHHAVERYETLSKTHPVWKDGTPVERRLVRETITSTIEEPAAPADT